MSIDKILKRIRMIESNDFNTNNDDEEVKEKPLDAHTALALLKGKKSADAAERIARDTLGGHGSIDGYSDSHSSSNSYISLPSQFEKQVQPLLTVAKKYNLIDDVNSGGKPLFGYTKPMFKGGRNNVLVLQKSGAIQVEFIDDALSKIKSINIKKLNLPQQNLSAFFNDINKNKSTYGIKSVSDTKKFIVINFV